MGFAVECRSCGTELPANAAYCHRCGVPAGCGACGAKLPPGAVYCPDCGIPLDEPESTDDFLWQGLWGGPIELSEATASFGAWSPAPGAPNAPSPAALPSPQRSWTLPREGPLGKLATLLSWPATLAGIYLAVSLWGEDRETALQVIGALALYALAGPLVGLVFAPLSLVIGFAIRQKPADTRGRASMVGRAIFEGLANLVSLAALVFIFVQLWKAVAS